MRKGNLTDVMQDENTKIGVAADDALEAPPMAPAVRSIVHKVFRITYWLRKSRLSFFLSLIIYRHTLLAPVLNYQQSIIDPKPADTSKGEKREESGGVYRHQQRDPS